MGNKKWIIIIASIAVVVAIGLGIGLGVGLNNEDDGLWYKENIPDGMGGPIEEKFELVNSTEDLNAIFGEHYNDTYNNKFFKKKSLIVLTFNAPNRGWEYSIKDVYIDDRVLMLEINAERPNGFWDAMLSPMCIFVEVKKADIKDIDNINKRIIETDLKGE